jgi:hypothetical protein
MNLTAIKKLNLGQAKESRIISLVKVCERNHIVYNLEKLSRFSRDDLVSLKNSALVCSIPPWATSALKIADESSNQIQREELCQVNK